MFILLYATTWMKPKDIMPSEIRQSQNDKHYRIPLDEESKVNS